MLTDKQVSTIRKNFNGTSQRIIFKMLCDTNRYRIFEMLGKHEKLTVSDVAKVLRISLPLASQHLKTLEQAKILKKEKIGRKVFYTTRNDNRISLAIRKGVI